MMFKNCKEESKWFHFHCTRVSFCDGSFYDDSLLRRLSSPDGALPTCGPSLSHLKRPFSTQCASSSFPVCMCFFFFYFSTFLLSWLWFFHSWVHQKDRKEEKIKTVDVTLFLDVFWTTAWAFFSKIKSGLIDILFQLSVLFSIYLTYLLTPWSRVLLEKLTSKLCS